MNQRPGYRAVLLENLGSNNPILVQVLGICSTLAVTNNLLNTSIMAIGVSLVTAMSSWSLSLMGSLIPRKIRMIVQVIVISFYVILVDIVLRAWAPDISKSLGPYVGLIITNCIIMGRAEAFAQANRPVISFWDGLTSGIGYMAVLMGIAVVRELLAFGTLFNLPVMPEAFTAGGNNWTIMVMAPSAFFLVGVLLWVVRTRQLAKAPAQGGKK